ncbi:hypothetical protein LSPH24S_02143 [Lysinibacillus sphaericus]
MYPQQVHNYLRQFFLENECDMIFEDEHYLTVQLTIAMDKRIMNRPFYWQYVEATNGEPNPAQVTFITEQNAMSGKVIGEVVHFGSPRLNQIFQATRELGAFVQMFQKVDAEIGQVLLTPWLGVNYKVSYCCNRTKEMLYSFGINLLTGTINNNFHEAINSIDWDSLTRSLKTHFNSTFFPYLLKGLIYTCTSTALWLKQSMSNYSIGLSAFYGMKPMTKAVDRKDLTGTVLIGFGIKYSIRKGLGVRTLKRIIRHSNN